MSARVYRDHLRCPHCGSNRTPKDGHSRGKQTYRCGQRRYRFTPDGNRHYYPEAVKTQAVTMYVAGMCVLDIGCTLSVKPGTIYSWLKKSIHTRTVLQVSRCQRRQYRSWPALVIAFDEMWTYVGGWRRGQRCSRWVRTAVVEEPAGGGPILRWAVGTRAFRRLCGRLPAAELYCSDGYRVYDWLPAARHLAGKGGAANRMGALHSFLGGKLNRLGRRKGHSKGADALRLGWRWRGCGMA